VPGHDAVARRLSPFHSEVGAAVLDQRVHFLEAALIEELLDPLAGRQLSLLVLSVDLVLSATAQVGGQPLLQTINDLTAHPDLPAPGILPRRHERYTLNVRTLERCGLSRDWEKEKRGKGE
jgi:hypothetical protein